MSPEKNGKKQKAADKIPPLSTYAHGKMKSEKGNCFFNQLAVDPIPHPGFAGGGQSLFNREPADIAVFVLLVANRSGRIRLQQKGDIQMQVGGDIDAVLLVAGYRQNFQRKQISGNGTGCQTALLLNLPQSNGQQILFAVCMAA